MNYDYLIVGAGLFGAVFAHEATARGKTCLVVDRNAHVGGTAHTERVEGIHVHRYGAHIFHTDDAEVWAYVNRFTEFNRFTNSPLANYRGEIYNLPFNMNTFYRMWGEADPARVREIIDSQCLKTAEPKNLEEQALALVGRDIYEKLVKGYTEKQWGRSCAELPAFIIRRIPLRFTWDNAYFNDRFQGIPVGGYTRLAEKLLEGSEVRLNTDFLRERGELGGLAARTVYTGMLDEFYDFRFGALEYRGLRFEEELLDRPDCQGNAVVNYTDRETPFTRVIEHKYFEFGEQPVTVVTREYPQAFRPGDVPYYPVNNAGNDALHARYRELAALEKGIVFGGRLADYKYYDMWRVVRGALNAARLELGDKA